MGKEDKIIPGTVGHEVVRVAEILQKRISVIRMVREELVISAEVYVILVTRKPLPDQYLNYKMPTYRNLSIKLGIGFSYYFVKDIIESSDQLSDVEKKCLEEISGKDYYRHTIGKLETIISRVLAEMKSERVSGIRLLTKDFEFRQAEMLNFLHDFLNQSERSKRNGFASRFNHLKKDDTKIRESILADAVTRLKKGEAMGSLFYCHVHKINQGRANRILKEGLEPDDYSKRKSILAKRTFYPNSKDNDVRFSIVADNLKKIIESPQLTAEQREIFISGLLDYALKLEEGIKAN